MRRLARTERLRLLAHLKASGSRLMVETKTSSSSAPDMFQGLNEEELREIERTTRTRAFTKGEVIYTPGETGEALFLLREGAVQIYRMSPEGRKLVIAHLLPQSFFGELSCIGQGMYDNFAEVTEDSVILTMNCAVRMTESSRSEEHTSELQSLAYLVCRLLL